MLSIAFAMEGERSTRPQVGEGVGDVIGSKLQLLLYFYDSVGTPDHDRFVETVFDNVGVLKLNSPSLSLSLSLRFFHTLSFPLAATITPKVISGWEWKWLEDGRLCGVALKNVSWIQDVSSEHLHNNLLLMRWLDGSSSGLP